MLMRMNVPQVICVIMTVSTIYQLMIIQIYIAAVVILVIPCKKMVKLVLTIMNARMSHVMLMLPVRIQPVHMFVHVTMDGLEHQIMLTLTVTWSVLL